MRKNEENLHLRVCDFLRKNYPDVIFRTDFSSGMKMTPGQAIKHKKFQSSRAYPDLFIAKTGRKKVAEINNNCIWRTLNGMFLELKAEGVKIYKKNGEIVANKHYQEQAEMLKKLRAENYYAEFAIGYEDAISQITNYLGEPKRKEIEF